MANQINEIVGFMNGSAIARYNWPHSFSCAARCLKHQLSCHNKRYIQLSTPKYRHYDIAYCYIMVPNKSHTL